jgi:hypothetical protein
VIPTLFSRLFVGYGEKWSGPVEFLRSINRRVGDGSFIGVDKEDSMVLAGVSPILLTAFLQDDGGILNFFAGALGLVCAAAGLFFIGLYLAGLWMIFEKAGQKGWKAIIPIYNWWVLLEIVGRPQWWIILFFIPVIQFIVWIVVYLDLAKSFDKSVWWGIGLVILTWLFVVILGFGDAQYYEPAGAKK